ncbi:aminotransferase class V-fold PLP-dependent enzyme [Pseudoalteromonas sp. NEC-BIFX-2020_002]|uniref:aminotransferase class V-fold PLP-dependent enzyme n=1 Tax=Pseudoalteromonas sp. NEC-BIFX-2020_002 TaxID=2732353 RepID=UPI001476FAD5|nr:aminotransferase class V-fold PLP-dependent enzyme [Pseudoalteromonas sp. NEC-BIFX-2020_002]NNG45320.1 aminotransferase class V-fold PLP-dependent enzyme [Pseudoalteromonas sp. NEC-BIFX-2020_002]
MYKDDFNLTSGCYLLNHSVGRSLKSSQADFNQHFFTPWQNTNKEPWQQWLGVITRFTHALGLLFNSPSEQFCPQVNLSSALTKLLMSHPRLLNNHCKVLMAQSDFPSMGFVMQKALPKTASIEFIPEHLDITDIAVWQQYLTADTDLVFISHAYSNTGQQAPVAKIAELCVQNNSLSLVDVAQSAGVLPLDLSEVKVDFMIGSSVKWLCSGPGAAYLWLSKVQLKVCKPQDVGWFSHENPFEFDIHHFEYHATALRFWGGTPSIAPFVIAGHSINYFANLGVENIRAHNLSLLMLLNAELGEFLVSPTAPESCSATAIFDFGAKQSTIIDALSKADISVDVRAYGVRVSPHIYNDNVDMKRFITLIKGTLLT